MPTAFTINGAQPYPFAKGALNAAFAERAAALLAGQGWRILCTDTAHGYDAEDEVGKHQQADVIILQMPVNWMGWPWSLKKYIDEVYTAGMDGRLCRSDGRTSAAPKANYGGDGSLTGKRYMLSLTFNAPEEAFGDRAEYLFQGRSVDDLLWPQHMNFRFFGMTMLPTFAAHDVVKDLDAEREFARFDLHLTQHLLAGGQ